MKVIGLTNLKSHDANILNVHETLYVMGLNVQGYWTL